MLTKGAFGNLVNRYRAVLKKCNLINTFGSLAVASMLVLGGAGVANAAESTITLNGQNATYDASATNPYLNSGYSGTQPNPLTLQGSGTEKVTLAGVGKQCAIASYANGTIHVNNLKELVVNGLWNSTDASVDYDGNVFYAQGAKYDNGTKNGHALVDIDMPNGTLKTDGVLKQAMLFHATATDTTSAKITVKAKTIDTATTSNSIVAQKNGTVDIDAENISMLSTAATTAITLGANALIDINASNGDANITSSTSPALWNMAGGAKIIVNASNDINLKGSKVINADGSNSTTAINAGKNVTITASDQDAIYAKNATINVTAGENININGGIIAENNSTITLNGKNTTINGDIAADSSTISITGNAALAGEATIGTLEGSINEITLASGDASLNITTNNTTGNIAIKGSGAANDALGGDKEALLAKISGLNNAEFTGMDEGLISGAVSADGTQKTNTVMQDTLDMVTAAPLAIGRVIMNDVRKRMGDLRDTKEESGVWMRWEGGKLKGDAGLTNNFNTIQIGADTMTGIENVRAGVAAAFTHGDLDHNNGEGENETYSFSAYATWMAENGMFADVIARVGFSNSEVTMKDTRIDLDNEALSLSGEYGWRLPVCEQFYVEPQVELTYTYVTGADSKVQYATYDVDSMDSLIGRAGLVAGWKLPSYMGSVYARASVVHEFLGDAKITGSALGNSIDLETDGKDTWIEYGIGANVKLTDKTYVWADVERTSGADIDEEWRGTVGLRYSF